MKIWTFSSVALLAALIALLVSCDKNPSGDEKEKVWTMEDCKFHVHDTLSLEFDECDSVLFMDFVQSTKWDGDTIPLDFQKFDEPVRVTALQIPNVKELSSRINQIWWWHKIQISGTLQKIPEQLWHKVGLESLQFGPSDSCAKLPDMISQKNPYITELIFKNLRVIKDLPKGMSKLENTHTLMFIGLNISELPEWVDSLEGIRTLGVHNSALVSFPLDVLALKNLITLNLTGNQITNIPDQICHLFTDTSIVLQDYSFNNNRICSVNQVVKECFNDFESMLGTQNCNQ